MLKVSTLHININNERNNDSDIVYVYWTQPIYLYL